VNCLIRFSRTAVAALVATVLSFSFAIPSAFAWPLAPQTFREYPPSTRSDGATWCGDVTSGSYGSAFFASGKVKVSYGGVCNAAWGRPAGWVYMKLERRNGSNVITASVLTTNPANSPEAIATVTHTASDGSYLFRMGMWNDTNNSWVQWATRIRTA
jgi:hypothetical protein